jgi:ankyrin repeat protein
MASSSKNPKLDTSAFSSTSKRSCDQPTISKKVRIDSQPQNIVDKETYKKDGLVHSLHGNMYQIKLILLFFQRGANKKCEFRIASERKAAEKFGDIEIRYDDDQGKSQILMIQVKHKQDSSIKITINDLLNVKDGYFSLQKYFLSYRKIKEKFHEGAPLKNLVLFTNIDLKDEIQSDFEKQTGKDDFLDISNKRGKCFKLKTDFSFRGKLEKILKDSSDLKLLTRKLVECLKYKKKIDQKNPLFKKYHIALSKHVIDATTKTIRLNHKEIPSFLFRELKDYQGKPVEVSENFASGFEKEPKLPKCQSSNLLATISAAFSKNVIDPIKISKNKDNAQLAGHVFVLVELDGKIKFREGFFTDQRLPESLMHFKDELLKLNTPNDLRSCSFDINVPLYTEEDYDNYKLDSEYFEKMHQLPNDTISGDEIEDFFKILIFAVDQPNEQEMFGVIDQEISESNCLKLKNITFLRNKLYTQIEEWMTTKQGKYLTNKDYEEKFTTVKQQISKFELVVRYKKPIYEEIKNYDVEFQEKLTVLQNFLEQNNEQVFILENSQSTLFSMIKLYYTLENIPKYKTDGSFILIRYEDLKSPDVTNRVLDAFKFDQYSDLLIIEFSTSDKNMREAFLREFFDILRKNEKKIVFVTRKALQLQNLDVQPYIFKDKKNGLEDLTTDSQRQIFKNTFINFQGHELCLNELVEKNSRDVIGEEILLKFIKKKKIHIGEKLPGLGEVKNYYVPRKYKEVMLEDSLTSSSIFVTTFDSSITVEDANAKSDQDIVLISDDVEFFYKLCEAHKTKNIHWVMKKNSKFVWKQSYGYSISKLRDFLSTCNLESIDVHELVANQILLISAPPGMGKSTEMTKIAIHLKQNDPFLWIMRVNLVELSTKFHDLKDDYKFEITGIFLKSFLSITEDDRNDFLIKFEEKLFDSYYEQGKMVLILDGFDEICPNYKNKVIAFLKNLKDSKVKKLCITTRSFEISTELEENLLTFSHTLEDLNEKDKIRIVAGIRGSQTNKNYSDEEKDALEQRAEKIIKSFQDVEQLGLFLNNPLQLNMVAKIFQDKDLENFSMKNFDQANLCEEFFNFLFDDIYIRKKNPPLYESRKKPSIKKLIIERRNEYIFFFKQIALYSLFGDEVKKFMLENFQNLTPHINKINSGEYTIGIIEKIIDEKPIFIHKSFAEYFTALYLADEIIWEKPDFRFFFRKRLLQEFMLRKFFGCLVAKNQNYKVNYSLHLASLQNNEAELEELLGKMKAEMDNVTFSEKLNEQDTMLRWTPLIYAINLEHFSVAEMLLKNGAGNKESNNDFSLTENSLYTAAFHNYVELIKFFHRHKSELMIKNLDKILDNAVENDAKDIVEYFLDSKLKTFNKISKNILHSAAKKQAFKVVEYLTSERKMDVNVQNNCGETPLHIASRGNGKDQLEMFKILIEQHHANISVKDKNGDTPLHLVAQYGSLGLVEYLITQTNIDVKVLNNDGKTPLHCAAKMFGKDQLEVFKTLFEQHRANMSVKDQNGDTPFHLAAQFGSFKLVEFLVKGEQHYVKVLNNDGKTPLHLAAKNHRKGQLKIFQILFEQHHANISAKDNNGNSLLHLAAQSGSLAIVTYLTKQGKNYVEVQNIYGKTPLHFAAKMHAKHQLEVFKTIIEQHHANISAKDRNGDTPLHLAAQYGGLNLVEFLVKQEKHDFNVLNNDGKTPLHLVAKNRRKDQLEIFQMLFEQNHANKSAKDNNGNTLLHFAAQSGSLEIVKYLTKQENIDFNILNNDGKTPLHYAARVCGENQLEIFETLFEQHRANVSVKDKNGDTPLHLVAQYGSLKLVEFLVKQEQNDIKVLNNDGKTPLHFAAKNKSKDRLEVFKTLFEQYHANINAKDCNGDTPLLLAIQNSDIKLVEYLTKEENIDVNISNYNGKTLLFHVVRLGKLKVVKHLIEERKADFNVKDKSGNTLLHNAASGRSYEIVKYLTNLKESDANASNIDGKIPLFLAVQWDRINVVQYFIQEKRVDINVKDNNGNTLLHTAALHSAMQVAKYLYEQENFDVHALNNCGQTPLHLARKHDLAEYFHQVQNVNINAKDKNGNTPLHIAASNNSLKVVKYLSELENADVNAQNVNKETPLHLAARQGAVNVVIYLHTKHNTGFNTKNKYGNTPLEVACLNGALKVVYFYCNKELSIEEDTPEAVKIRKWTLFFLKTINYFGSQRTAEHICAEEKAFEILRQFNEEKKAEMKAENDCGNTPLHNAAANNALGIVKYLSEQENIDINFLNRSGQTPLHLAAKNEALDVVKYFVVEKMVDIDAKDKQGHTPLELSNGKVKYYLSNLKTNLNHQ